MRRQRLIFEERRTGTMTPNNDLYLFNVGRKMFISREHMQIERCGDVFEVVDRGSFCGTTVDGNLVGGENRGGRCTVRDGSVIVLGTAASPYAYRLKVGKNKGP